MHRRCGEGGLAWAADGFASLNRDVLPSSAGLSNSHLKATAGQSYKCQQAHSKQSFSLARPLASKNRQPRPRFKPELCESAVVLVSGQPPLMLQSDRHLPPAHPPLFWSPLSSRRGSELGINCTSERLPLPSWCLLRSQPAVLVLALKFIPQSESSFQSISIHNALTHKDGTLGNLDSSSSSLSISLASFQCNYMHFRQPYIQL